MKHLWLAAALILTSCASNPSASDRWERRSVDLSGRKISFSSPPGSFRETHVPAVDLAKNTENYVTLFKSAWIFSGIVGDAGALELIVGLNRSPVGSTDEDLLRGIQKNVSATYDRTSPQPIVLRNVTSRQLGGRKWLCYVKSVYGHECALKVDENHYMSWRLTNIDNRASQIDSRDALRARIEESVWVAF